MPILWLILRGQAASCLIGVLSVKKIPLCSTGWGWISPGADMGSLFVESERLQIQSWRWVKSGRILVSFHLTRSGFSGTRILEFSFHFPQTSWLWQTPTVQTSHKQNKHYLILQIELPWRLQCASSKTLCTGLFTPRRPATLCLHNLAGFSASSTSPRPGVLLFIFLPAFWNELVSSYVEMIHHGSKYENSFHLSS